MQLRLQMHMSIYSVLCAAHDLQKIKEHEPLAKWHEALAALDVNEVRAQYLLNLVDKHDRRIRNGASHWDVMEQFMAEGTIEKLLGLE